MFHLKKLELILVPQMKEGLNSYSETPACKMEASVASWVASVRPLKVFENPDL